MTELNWFQFLDHGYVQMPNLPVEQWWTIRLLSASEAGHLGDFVRERYPGRYADLCRTLDELAAA